MILNKDSKFISFRPKIVTSNEIQKLSIPKEFKKIVVPIRIKVNGVMVDVKGITEVNGKYYYFKKVDFMELINELIGSYLSKQICLNAVDYQIGIYNGEIYALSQLFYNPNCEYYSCEDYFGRMTNEKMKESESFFRRIYLKEDSMLKLVPNPVMLLNILKLTFLDIKMGQIDRNNPGNLMVARNNGLVDLAPIIDFGLSFLYSPPYPEFYFYDNPFLVLIKNRLSLSSFIRKYPQILDTVKILATLKIKDVLNEIQDEKRILLKEEQLRCYEVKDKKYSKVLQKII